MTDLAAAGRWTSRVAASFRASLGTIVFGLVDGAVSIFGLVAGVSAAGQDAHTVLIAGATGAAAAAASMAAGAWLDATASRDVAAADIERDRAALERDPAGTLAAIRERLASQGAEPASVDVIVALAKRNPEAWASLRRAAGPAAANPPASPAAQAAWMFVADLFAASMPVIPFAFLEVDAARTASLVVTLAMMTALGWARSAITGSPRGRTIAQTLGVTMAAALAGLAIGSIFRP